MKGKCRTCGKKTESIVNINLAPVFVCDYCCGLISIQTTRYLVNKHIENLEGSDE